MVVKHTSPTTLKTFSINPEVKVGSFPKMLTKMNSSPKMKN